MVIKNRGKIKMTIEKLARIAQEEFLAVRRDMITKDYLKDYLNEKLQYFATKHDLQAGLNNLKEEMRGETAKILRGVDTIVARFDRKEKEEAAHAVLHERLDDTLYGHEERIKKLEARV